MPLASLSRHCLEPSFQASKYRSKGITDPKDPVRLQFPGGWPSRDSAVFRWYDIQPYKYFQKLQYLKERHSVGHEYIVLLLQDEGGHATNWFCRLERTADPSQQLASIGDGGTEAFDYIKSSNDDFQVVTRDSSLVAEVTLPRAFDLYDVLAICSALSEHERAHRYTLQQFNCYFFSWAIILMLARRAANWESIFLGHLGSVKETILRSLATTDPTKEAKLALILSAAHDSNPGPEKSSLIEVLTSELSSEEFAESTTNLLSSMLWANRGATGMEQVVKTRLKALANQTLELFLGDLQVEPDRRLARRLTVPLSSPSSVDARAYALEAALMYHTKAWSMVAPHLRKQAETLKKSSEISDHPPKVTQSIKRRIACSPPSTFLASALLITLLVPLHGVLGSVDAARHHNEIAIHKRRAPGLRKVMYAVNTVRHFPRHMSIAFKVGLHLTSILAITLKNENRSLFGLGLAGTEMEVAQLYNKFQDQYCPHALSLTMAKICDEHPEWDRGVIRRVTFQLMIELADEIGMMQSMSPRDIWSMMLWECLGEIMVKATLEVIMREQPTDVQFVCSQLSEKPHQPKQQLAATVELQHFIEERIVRLSKHDVEHAPIVRYIPLPSLAPPPESQEQMKVALEDIWRTVNLGGRFRIDERLG
ncbi:hypothetical protein FRC10_011399 [Ceratobasidium sp. 414]|nr:hypothetical protein FRC10_011399 [Ceratobasidium sp. 414]